MARCQRCYACESMWSNPVCRWCGFPGDDTRNTETIIEDNEFIKTLEENDDAE